MLMFVIDQAFIDEFCRKHSVSQSSLMQSVRSNLYSYSPNIKIIKGILAIQMYAASKRANKDGVTEKNYRERLSQVLNWDLDDLQRWMSDYQEHYWETLYRWCDTHFFDITKCKRKSGAGRYVQYPVKQALCVFTEEDLLYISGAFVDCSLQPNEDLQESEFWRIVGKRNVIRYFKTSHSGDVLENTPEPDNYFKQIFNHYLRWNGDYKTGYSQKKVSENTEADVFLYLRGDLSSMDFRDSKLNLKHTIPMTKVSYLSIQQHFRFKHDGLILFKKDDIYEDNWQETRYIEKGQTGIAVLFTDKRYLYNEVRGNILFQTPSIKVFELKETLSTLKFFTETRFYSLEGGLKVGRNTYLLGAAPILVLSRKEKFWIDGNEPEKELVDGKLNLNYLSEGLHNIKFRNFKKLEFELVSAKPSAPDWIKTYNKWNLKRSDTTWDSGPYEQGIVGMDFSFIPQRMENEDSKPPLQQWARVHLDPTLEKNSNNIAVKVLKNIL